MKAGGNSYAGWRRRGRPRYAGTLTPRQQDVFELLVTGLTNEEIAQHLGIAANSVKYHVAEILQRLGVDNRHDAVALHLRTETSSRLAALAPIVLLRKLPFGWLAKAAALAVLTAAAAGIALLTWGVLSTSSVAVTTPGCSVEQSAGGAPDCAPGAAQTGATADTISAISAGVFHTCALKGGGVWCWGGSFAADSGVPVAVLALTSGVSAISADGPLRCALKDGGAWCWLQIRCCGGGGNFGPVDSPAPVAMSGLASGVSAISENCAVKDGGVWCWEASWDGQLGGDSTTGSPVPVAVPALATGVSAISASGDHVCALKDGGVACWGSNFSRQLGNNGADSAVPVVVSGLTTGVSAISAGGGYNCALKDGGVWCWGDNSKGQLGNNNTTDVCGLNFFPCSHVPVAVPGLTTGVSAITAATAHSCALKDGGVWCWGPNFAGELGNGSRIDSPVPVPASGLASGVSAISAGFDHSCALKDGAVWCWGGNFVGQLGNNSTTYSSVPRAVLFPPPGAGDIAAGTDAQPSPSSAATDSADHRTAYALAGVAAAALAVVSAGVWTVWRRRRIT